jgi:sugar lactone lactonase YvrE
MRTRLQLFCCVAVLFCVAGYAQSVGNITTVAGSSTGGYSGDGGLSISAKVYLPFGVALDKSGNFYIADTGNNRVRKVNISTYTITTVAGNGKLAFCGDGGPATSACLSQPTGVAVDSAGALYIADNGNYRIRRVDTSGKITTYAGNGSPTFCGDGQPATLACLHTPTGVAVDTKGNVYVADEYSCRVRKILASNHTITTVAGNGAIGSSGDGGLAIFAELGGPTGVAVDPAGNLYIADWGNHRVRQVNPSGIISTLAGNGTSAFCGDGGVAASACLRSPYGVAVDGSGNVFIADSGNSRIRKVTASTKKISTVAGGGSVLGDNGPATKASLAIPYGVAVFPTTAGSLPNSMYIADQGHNRIRRVTLK